jgi:hypothetical protein
MLAAGPALLPHLVLIEGVVDRDGVGAAILALALCTATAGRRQAGK